MLDRLRYALILTAACGAFFAVGCAEESAELPSVAEAPPAVVPSSPPNAPSGAGSASESVKASATSSLTSTENVASGDGPEAEEAGKSEASDAAEFKAPFPDRVDLFVAPKRQGGSGAQTNGDNLVELMGFVRVDRQRAVLAINGEITPLAEGETQFGVQVISVRPPMVVLQRGRQRWQATLE